MDSRQKVNYVPAEKENKTGNFEKTEEGSACPAGKLRGGRRKEANHAGKALMLRTGKIGGFLQNA
jgi:hypothetical protein